MNLLYKIISKLLANRLNQFLSFLVDQEQTGFITGRHIQDNILAFRIGKEFVRAKRLRVMLVMWDFLKAYDRTAHIFLWQIMEAMGFSPLFIKLVQGLVLGGSSTVHANNLFSREVDLFRGVRQGCPIAPFLFILTS